MKDIDLLPNKWRQLSISQDEIVVPYEASYPILDFFRMKGYAALGCEVLHVSETEHIEIRTFISYFPDAIVWEEFVNDAYHQVRNFLEQTYKELLYGEEELDDIYVLLTFVNRQEFETYYYDFIAVD